MDSEVVGKPSDIGVVQCCIDLVEDEEGRGVEAGGGVHKSQYHRFRQRDGGVGAE